MVAIYVRQSLDKKDSLSIEGQIDKCKKFADEEIQIYSDKGYSGKNIKRPAFTQLIRDVEAGKIQKILVYRLDRFSRSIADFSRLWELLETHGVEFYSVTENFDTSSPMGRAMLNIVLVFAQLERETTAIRVKDNYVHRFNLGAWPGGPAPYGFDLTKVSIEGRKISTLIPNEKAQIVKYIYEEYATADASLRSVAKALNEKGIHGPRRELWDNVTLSRLLHSPLYVCATPEVLLYYLSKGMHTKDDIDAFDGVHACNVIGKRDRSKNKYNELADQMLSISNHEGFIDAELWLAVQEKLSKNPQIPRANIGKYSWLTGLLKCGKCGYALKFNYSKKEDKLRLFCSGKSNFAHCDNTIKANIGELESYIEQAITKMLEEAPVDAACIDNSLPPELLEIEKKIERLVNALAASSEVSAEYIMHEIEKLHKERERILSANTLTHRTHNNLNFKAASFDEKKIIAAEFIERILITGNEVNIVWRA